MLLSIPYILVLCSLVIPTETIPKQQIFARKFEGKFGKSEFSLGISEQIIGQSEFSLEIYMYMYIIINVWGCVEIFPNNINILNSYSYHLLN